MIDELNPEKTIKEFEFQWGVYDVVDNCWVGNAKGPLKFSHERACACATIVNERMQTASRYRAKIFLGGPMHLKDEVNFRISVEKAFRNLEGRAH